MDKYDERSADEYESLVKQYYPDKITLELASRMLALEQILDLKRLK